MSVAWPEIERRQEAGDDAARAIRNASDAAGDILSDRNALDRDTVKRVAGYLVDLKKALSYRLMGGTGGLTTFKRSALQALMQDTDRLILQTQKQLADFAGDAIEEGGALGQVYGTAPIEAAGLTVQSALPGLDAALVRATFENTARLLSPPMRQYGDQVKQAVRRVALAGETSFEEIQRLAKVIDEGGNAAQFKAERIIRTEVGRVFGEATFDRLTALSKEFPFIRKGWRASKDSRTRKGHVEAGATYARGKGTIAIASLFEIAVYDERPGKAPKRLGTARLRFPIDPNTTPAGRLAAGATIMCRCNSFIDFSQSEFRAFSQKRIAQILPPSEPLEVEDEGPTPVPAMQAAPAPAVPIPTPAPVVVPVLPDRDVRRPGRGRPATARWMTKLTPEERKALTLYVKGDGYKTINVAARTGQMSAVTKGRIERIEKAIEKAGRYDEPVVVWRGIRTPPDLLAQMQPGASFQMAGFQSSSFDPGMAVRFKESGNAGIILEIRADRGAWVEPIAKFKTERELLLQNNQRFQVLGRKSVQMRGLDGKITTQQVIQVQTVD